MNSHDTRKISARLYAMCAVIAAMFLCASISPAFGQERSQDRDNPQPLHWSKDATIQVTDDLDGSNDEYFYAFVAGPGKLKITFEVKASGTNVGAHLDLFAKNSRPLLSDALAQGVDSGSGQVVKSVQLGRSQQIIMRIKGIRYGDSGGTGVYTVLLSGAEPPANVDGAAAPAGSNRLTGELDGTDSKQSHNLTITGPGKVTLIFDVKASGTNAGASFDLLDGRSKPILSDILVQGVDSGSERVSKTVTFTKSQTVTILVKGIRYGDSGGQGVYSVQLNGPVAQVKQ